MPVTPSPLRIRAGRLFCPATGRDGAGEVVVRGGRIAELNWHDDTIHRPAASPFDEQSLGNFSTNVPTLNFPNGLLLPGLVDLHGHPAGYLSKYGVEADEYFLARGTTTVLSQGDAGAEGWPRFRDEVIGASQTRVRLAINLAKTGESGPLTPGCFHDPAALDLDACLRAIDDGGTAIWGLAVNLSTHACGPTNPRVVLLAALSVAQECGKPLLFGPRRGADDFSWEEQLAALRPGDVVTYCFDGGPHSIVRDGRLRLCVRQAQDRGVLFDLGHGAGSFDFATAEAAIDQGFLPDTISTDLHRGHVGQLPRHDLPRTLSKLMAVGMSAADAFARVTWRPAQALGLSDEIGSLHVGSCADLTVLQIDANAAPLADTRGVERAGPCWQAALTIRAGALVEGNPA